MRSSAKYSSDDEDDGDTKKHIRSPIHDTKKLVHSRSKYESDDEYGDYTKKPMRSQSKYAPDNEVNNYTKKPMRSRSTHVLDVDDDTKKPMHSRTNYASGDDEDRSSHYGSDTSSESERSRMAAPKFAETLLGDSEGDSEGDSVGSPVKSMPALEGPSSILKNQGKTPPPKSEETSFFGSIGKKVRSSFGYGSEVESSEQTDGVEREEQVKVETVESDEDSDPAPSKEEERRKDKFTSNKRVRMQDNSTHTRKECTHQAKKVSGPRNKRDKMPAEPSRRNPGRKGRA